jgi:hypothetical protein
MAKAILELEMPRNCKNCPLKYYLDYSERNYPWEDYVCTIIGKGIADKGRRSDCPLKPVEGKDEQTNVKCRYCNSESVEIIARGTESILYKCKACKMEFAKLNIKEVEP